MDNIFIYKEINGEVIITGLKEGVSDTSIVIPETIDGMPVVAIGPRAFSFTSITGIKIGENISKIGNDAFYSCKKLSSVTWNHKCDVIPDFCFSECSNLTKFDFSNVKKIGLYAFYKSGLQEVYLPENIEVVSEWPFGGCSELHSVTWHCQCDVIPANCFYECANLKVFDFSTIKKVGQYAFSRSGLQEICLPENIECISEGAFNGCSELHSVTWHCQCDIVSTDCFYKCVNLKAFDFSGIKRVEKYAFGKSGLQEVCLPENIEVIEEGTFRECSGLRSVTWNCKCDVISAYCFSECSNLTNFDFSGIKKIEKCAFWESGLFSVTLSKGTTVNKSCFAFCGSLAKVEWLSARNIKDSIFEGCENIKEIYISDKVKNIEANAFESSPNAEITFV